MPAEKRSLSSESTAAAVPATFGDAGPNSMAEPEWRGGSARGAFGGGRGASGSRGGRGRGGSNPSKRLKATPAGIAEASTSAIPKATKVRKASTQAAVKRKPKPAASSIPVVDRLCDERYVDEIWSVSGGTGPPPPQWASNPKGVVGDYVRKLTTKVAEYTTEQVRVEGLSQVFFRYVFVYERRNIGPDALVADRASSLTPNTTSSESAMPRTRRRPNGSQRSRHATSSAVRSSLSEIPPFPIGSCPRLRRPQRLPHRPRSRRTNRSRND